MADTQRLIAACEKWNTRKKSLLALSELPVTTKREHVYGPIVDLTVRLLCTESGADKVYYEIDPLEAFFLRELDDEPGLAARLYAAMPGPPVHNIGHFLRIVVGARDPSATRLLEQTPDHGGWGDAVVAVDAGTLGAAAAHRLEPKGGRDRSLPAAAAFYAPQDARGRLHDLLTNHAGSVYGAFAVEALAAVALAGHPADDAWARGLRSDKASLIAKRLHAALTGTRLGPRTKALDAIAKTIKSEQTPLALLLGLCKLLGDEDPSIVERAAIALREYVRLGKKAHVAHHAIFLQRAQAAIDRGVTKNARAALDAVRKKIPRSEPFSGGETVAASSAVKPPPKRTRKKKVTPKPATPKWHSVSIQGAVIAESGAIYALREHGPRDESEVTVLRGRPNGRALELHTVSEPAPLRSIIPLQGRWADRAEVAAVDIDGEVWLIGEDGLTKEHVKGPKPKRGRRPFTGHMMRMRQRGDRLFVTGFRGQIHVRPLDGPWAPAVPSGPTMPTHEVLILDVSEGSDGLVAVGRAIGELDHAALEGIDDSDPDAYSSALLGASPPDEACVLRWTDRRWHRCSLPAGIEARSVFEIIEGEASRHFVADDGTLLHEASGTLSCVGSVPALEDIETSAGRTFALADQRIVELTGGKVRDFSPALPAKFAADGLSAAGKRMMVTSSKQVLLLAAGRWHPLRCKLWR